MICRAAVLPDESAAGLRMGACRCVFKACGNAFSIFRFLSPASRVWTAINFRAVRCRRCGACGKPQSAFQMRPAHVGNPEAKAVVKVHHDLRTNQNHRMRVVRDGLPASRRPNLRSPIVEIEAAAISSKTVAAALLMFIGLKNREN